MYKPAGSVINGFVPLEDSGVKKLFPFDSIAKTLVFTTIFKGPLISAFTIKKSPCLAFT